ncbi:MAG: Coenzyme F420 hydrogenase/dehydrogenase, beta subunit C-terminal domain [Nitrososphaerales archaeon]
MSSPKTTFKDFYHIVVDSGQCCGCGSCVAVCPLSALSYLYDQTLPVLVGKCTDCGVCFKACPRYNFNVEEVEKMLFNRTRSESEVFGVHHNILAARSRIPDVLKVCQDGGLVSSLLIWALENKVVDAAVVASFNPETWDAKPRFVRTREEVLSSAGTRYTYSPNNLLLREAGANNIKVAFVGTGCEVEAVRKMQYHKLRKSVGTVVFTIGLMCHESYTMNGLIDKKIRGELGIEPNQIAKMNIKGKIIIETKDGKVAEIGLKDARQYVRKGCFYCGDFSAELADISAGGAGAQGWTICVVRTDQGKNILESAEKAGYLEIEPIEKHKSSYDTVVKLSNIQRNRRAKALSGALNI